MPPVSVRLGLPFSHLIEFCRYPSSIDLEGAILDAPGVTRSCRRRSATNFQILCPPRFPSGNVPFGSTNERPARSCRFVANPDDVPVGSSTIAFAVGNGVPELGPLHPSPIKAALFSARGRAAASPNVMKRLP